MNYHYIRKAVFTATASLCVLGLIPITGCPPATTTDPDPNASPRLIEGQLYYPTGDQPFGIVTGDFNADGLLDTATANEEADSVSVLLQRTSGGFGFDAQQKFTVGQGPVALITADLNGDAKLDIVTVNSTSNDLSVLLGVGDGTFVAESRLVLPVDAAPLDVGAGDLNGDTFPDLVATNTGLGTLTLFLGAGDGTFAIGVEAPAGGGPRSVALADLNGDGKADIVCANRETNNVSILLTNATGYNDMVTRGVGGGPRTVRLADLDGDTVLDMVVSNPSSGDFSILPGLGGGTFGSLQQVDMDALPTRFTLGDLDGDNDPDIAVVLFSLATDPAALGLTAVLLNDGDGNFDTEPRYFGARGGSIDIAAGELTNDSRIDLVTANNTTDDISVLVGRGDGSFESDERFAVGTRPRSVVAGDLDEDNTPDLVVGNLDSGDISVLIGNGDGTFARAATLNVTGTPRAVILGQVNTDAHLDVAACDFDSGQISLFTGRGNGTFNAERRIAAGGVGARPRSLALGDLDDDGDADLVVANSNADKVAVLLGDGTGAFAAPALFDAGNFPLDVQVIDADGDSNLDVIFLNGYDESDDAQNQNPRLRSLFGAGDGTLASRTGFGPYGIDPDPRSLVLEDLNSDGIRDAVIAHPGRDVINVLRGKADGKFLTADPHIAGGSPNSVAVGDMNSDRRPDLISTNSDDCVSIQVNNGNLNFSSALTFPAGNRPISVLATDLNDDGSVDVVLVNPDTDDISVILGRG